MTISYTARNIFNKADDGWKKYIEFSGLTQADEIVSLDCSLNDSVLKFDSNSEKDWKFALTIPDNCNFTDCYSSLDYVLSKTKDKKEFDLLAVCFEPTTSCNNFAVDGFTFIGYDLLDQSHGNSALTNCGGAPDVFANSELNKFGLIDNFDRAKEIQEKLFETCPEGVVIQDVPVIVQANVARFTAGAQTRVGE